MKFRILTISVVCVVFASGFVLSAFGQELKPIQLPEPKSDPNKSLVQAFKDRKTSREYSGDKPSRADAFKPALGCMGHKPLRFRQTNCAFRGELAGD